MPEAPPSSPGHVGHTPQLVSETLMRARLRGALSATVPTTPPHYGPYASHTFRQPQRFRRRSLFTVLASIDRMARVKRDLTYRQPWPEEFREGVIAANE